MPLWHEKIMDTTDIEASHWSMLQSCASYLKLLLMQPNSSTFLGQISQLVSSPVFNVFHAFLIC